MTGALTCPCADHGTLRPTPSALYLMAISAGLDPVHVAGSGLVGSLAFKGWINLSIGRPFVDAAETSDPDGDGRAGRCSASRSPPRSRGGGRASAQRGVRCAAAVGATMKPDRRSESASAGRAKQQTWP